MSTRCTIHFHDGNSPKSVAIIYRHSDGYPESVLPDLQQFFAEVQKQTSDTRFADPSYLAAKYVVWQATENARHYDFDTNQWQPSQPLDFLGLGVLMSDPSDIEHRYHILCTNGLPEVRHETVP